MKRLSLKQSWVALLMVTMFLGQSWSARADVIAFSPTGAGGTTYNVGAFGMDTGNALAKAAITNGSLVVGNTFQLLYEARLANLSVPGGGTLTPPGLNGTAGAPPFEITVVASITELVLSANLAAGTATFATNSTQTGSFINFYYHPGLITDEFNGTGYTSGQLILSAAPSSLLPSAGNYTNSILNGQPVIGALDQFDPVGSAPNVFFAATSSVTGSGSALVSGVVGSADSNFFKTNVVGGTLSFNAFDNTPFLQTTPTKGFYNVGTVNSGPTVVPSLGGVNGVVGPDFQFQSRTAISLTSPAGVPEPGTFTLALCLGAIGLAGYRLKTRKQSA